MRTTNIGYLLEVVRCGSINKASKKLLLSQQQLSKIVSSMENEFGITIFERSIKGTVLTEHGKIFIEKIKQLNKILNEMHQISICKSIKNRSLLKGTLSIHSFSTIWGNYFTEIINDFSKVFPCIKIHLDEKSNVGIVNMVNNDAYSIGMFIIIKDIEKEETLIPDNLTFLPVYECEVAAYASPNSAFVQKYKSTSLKSLLKQPLVVYSHDEVSYNLAYRLLSPYGIPNIKYCISNLATFYTIIESGSYITIASSGRVADPHISDKLVKVPIRDNPCYRIGLLIQKKAKNNPIIDAFIDFYIRHFT